MESAFFCVNVRRYSHFPFFFLFILYFFFGCFVFWKMPPNYSGLLFKKKKRCIPVIVLWRLIGFQVIKIHQWSIINLNLLNCLPEGVLLGKLPLCELLGGLSEGVLIGWLAWGKMKLTVFTSETFTLCWSETKVINLNPINLLYDRSSFVSD